jgi:hypothetical protein
LRFTQQITNPISVNHIARITKHNILCRRGRNALVHSMVYA